MASRFPSFASSIISTAMLRTLVGDAHAAESRTHLLPFLSRVEAEVGAQCACDSFRVVWELDDETVERILGFATVESVNWNRTAEGTPREGVTLQIAGPGERADRWVWIRGTPECRVEGYRARRALTKSTILDASDRAFERGWAAPGVASRALAAASDPTGSYVERPITAGAWITRDDVRVAPAVRRGEPVEVWVQTSGLEVRCVGKSRRDAWIGERVRVHVEGARRDCEGSVVADGVVRVRVAVSGG